MPETIWLMQSYLALEHVLYAKLLKLLGIWLQNDLGMRKQVDYIMRICNQHTYLLTQLKRQGLPVMQLKCVFDQ